MIDLQLQFKEELSKRLEHKVNTSDMQERHQKHEKQLLGKFALQDTVVHIEG